MRALSTTTERLLVNARHVGSDLNHRTSVQLAPVLLHLVDSLVHDLVPLMAAEETVVCPRLTPSLGEAISRDHSEVRDSADQLAMLSADLQGHLPRLRNQKPLGRALSGLVDRLERLLAHQLMAQAALTAAYSTSELKVFDVELACCEAEARKQTVLVAWPQVSATTAVVLRSRPDLQVAYPISLAELERQGRGVD